MFRYTQKPCWWLFQLQISLCHIMSSVWHVPLQVIFWRGCRKCLSQKSWILVGSCNNCSLRMELKMAVKHCNFCGANTSLKFITCLMSKNCFPWHVFFIICYKKSHISQFLASWSPSNIECAECTICITLQILWKIKYWRTYNL